MEEAAHQPIEIAIPETGTVSGILIRPVHCRAVIALAHGAGAGMEHPFMEKLAQSFAHYHLGSMRYQFPYMEMGRKSPDRPAKAIKTVLAAIEKARELAAGIPLFAGGKSYGGRMSSHALAEHPGLDLKGLIFAGFPLHAPAKPSKERAAHLQSVPHPMLFLQGSRDRLAKIDLIEEVVSDLGEKAKIFRIEDGDHSFNVPKRSGKSIHEIIDAAASVTAKWVDTVLTA